MNTLSRCPTINVTLIDLLQATCNNLREMFQFPSRAFFCAVCTLQDAAYIQSFVRVLLLPCRKPRTKSRQAGSARKSISDSHPNAKYGKTLIYHTRTRIAPPVVSLILPAPHPPDICSTALKITSLDRQSSPPSCHS